MDAIMGRCYGAEDEQGNPICEGEDVRHVRAIAPCDGGAFETEWCDECRAIAEADGYTLVSVGGAQ